jgi:ABC-2 type transport system permease protein
MFRQIRLIGALALKDWRLFLADRRAAILCFLTPIVLASAFGMIFDQPGQRLAHAKSRLIVVMEDDSPLAQKIVDDLRHSDRLEIHVADRATAEREVASRSADMAAIVPAGFSRMASLRSGNAEKPSVVMLHHPLAELEARWVEGVFTEIAMRRAAREILEPLKLDVSAIERPFVVERRPISASSDHPFNSLSHSFSGMMLQYLLFWGMECGLSLLRERQRGIWARIRTGPASLSTVLLGRACSTAAIGSLQIAATFGFGYIVFGVTITGSVAGFLLLAAGMCLLSAGVGLLVAAVGQTEAGARSIFIVVILAVSMLGGLWLPAFLLPSWVQKASLALPTSWAMRGLDGVTWQGSSLASIWPCLLAINLFAVAFLTVAMIRFHQSEARRRHGEIV